MSGGLRTYTMHARQFLDTYCRLYAIVVITIFSLSVANDPLAE
jgi:hypothetical protein